MESFTSFADSKILRDIRNPKLDATAKLGMYTTWAQNYEQDMTSQGVEYAAHIIVSTYVNDTFGDKKDARILDIGAGTGLTGDELRRRGFTCLDALDASTDMLAIAKEKNIYQNLIQAFLGPQRLDITNGTYDGIVGSGVLTHGHAEVDCFEELIRILRPGGWFAIVVHPSYVGKFESRMRQVEKDGRWRCVRIVRDLLYEVDTRGTLFHLEIL